MKAKTIVFTLLVSCALTHCYHATESNNPDRKTVLTSARALKQQVVYACENQIGAGTEICIMNEDGTGKKILTSNNVEDTDPALSPDGSRIAFVRYLAFDNSEIFIMNIDGTRQTQITFRGGYNSDPRWSPNGALILFTYTPTGAMFGANLWVMKTTGHGQQAVTTDIAANNGWGDWSPDSRSIVFQSQRHCADPFICPSNLYIIQRGLEDGSLFPIGPITRLTTTADRSDTGPRWSPLGHEIAYECISDFGFTGICTINISTLARETLVDLFGSHSMYPDWDPYGKRIVFQSDATGNRDVWMLTVSTGALARFTTNPGRDERPSWRYKVLR